MSSGAQQQYDVMALDRIAALPVAGVMERNAIGGIWATVPMLLEALEVLRAWGFNYKTADFWIKAGLESPRAQRLVKAVLKVVDALAEGKPLRLARLRAALARALEEEEVRITGKMGMGFWLRGNVEILLIGVRGEVSPPLLALRNFHMAVATEHSRKPEAARARLEEIACRSFGEWGRVEKPPKTEGARPAFQKVLTAPAPFTQIRALELFARRQAPGWTPVGLGVDGVRAEDALARMISDLTPQGSLFGGGA